MPVRIQTEDFDLSQEIKQLRAGDARVGAVASFVGTVRDRNDGSEVAAMTLEHYPGMTEKSLEEIIEKAKARWDIFDVLIIHRVGPLNIEDQIVLTAVTSAHRGEAFAACEYVMDYLKTLAPFWKKEDTPEGARWVDARLSDDEALKKWQ
ncbi:MAG: molybdopterin synthase catalytic subunit MoaE [Pseudomonadota bacterium]|jgi:molybdopterin synthase catalytic subunit|uniref:Molybdopterin synthase catalytic subunit n=1 Tax=Polynucleobacter cosmopolitanus TaxID=351345 RepID=A0A229FR43_9BURK|nr:MULTISPECIES: molybdopterin synthase catalytic subunit MoaE [Polynucleobacter]OXL14475.1 molybdenum cofactor biosynthesis protein MoaE [Polynucleobacter cosmopolitanus]QWD89556.1 molybdopterin synthase catalytic subunit MoaE [Polynucleobacter sp. MWH-CaK5]